MKVFKLRPHLFAALAVLVIQGCAFNPLVRPEPAPSRETVATPNPRPLQSGLDFVAERRNAYEDKVREFVTTKVVLSNSLIGIGVVGTALVASRGVHRDAILGTALVGGTGLAYGQWNLDDRRLPIYEKAIGAYLCLERAASPFDLSATAYAALKAEDASSLATLVSAADVAVTRAESELGAWNAEEASKKPYQLRIDAARTRIDTARKVAVEALRRVSGIEQMNVQLVLNARQIDARARKDLEPTVGSLEGVSGVIASIPVSARGFANGFDLFPAAKTDGTPDGANTSQALRITSDGKPLKQLSVPAALENQMQALDDAVRVMAARALVVDARLAALPDVRLETLDACAAGAGGSAGMITTPDKLYIVPGKAGVYPIAIQGGKPPFGIKPSGPELAGLTVVPPVKLESEFSLSATAALAEGSRAAFVVTDSSTPIQRFELAVVVGDPPTPSADKVSSKGIDQTGADATKAKPFRTTDGVTLSITNEASKDGVRTVALACKPPAPKPCLKPAVVREAYLVERPADKSLTADQLKLINGPGSTCICKD